MFRDMVKSKYKKSYMVGGLFYFGKLTNKYINKKKSANKLVCFTAQKCQVLKRANLFVSLNFFFFFLHVKIIYLFTVLEIL